MCVEAGIGAISARTHLDLGVSWHFSLPEVRFRISVFIETRVSCRYCRMVHSFSVGYIIRGIGVLYLKSAIY